MTTERDSVQAFRSRRVNPLSQRVVKFLPDSPPWRGEHVLVDGVRCRVTRCRVRWDGPRWTIKKLYVKEDLA